MRIRVLILAAFIGISASLLPIAIAETNLEEELVWKISSATFLLMLGGLSSYTAVRHFQLSNTARDNIPLTNLIIGWTCAATSILLLASNLLQVPILGYSFSYTLSLLLVLSVGATNFYTIAIQKLLEL